MLFCAPAALPHPQEPSGVWLWTLRAPTLLLRLSATTSHAATMALYRFLSVRYHAQPRLPMKSFLPL